jgi:hypothetical protein
MTENELSRWYIAPMMPLNFDLEDHFWGRRSFVEVRAKRYSVIGALEPDSFPYTQSVQLPIVQTATRDDFRAKAKLYRELASTLTDPQVISVVEGCARELDAKARRR